MTEIHYKTDPSSHQMKLTWASQQEIKN